MCCFFDDTYIHASTKEEIVTAAAIMLHSFYVLPAALPAPDNSSKAPPARTVCIASITQ